MKKKEISRRDFLRGTAAGALSVAAAGVLGACSSQAGDAATTAPLATQPQESASAQEETETAETSAPAENDGQKSDAGSHWLGEARLLRRARW